MPLYMDFHQFESITVEDVKKAHIADISVQEKFGVKYHQFWVNEVSGSVFCLVEGPDPKTCELCHQVAHGNIACNIQEVEPGFFNLFMGEKQFIDHGLTINHDGSIDNANRILLVADIRGITLLDNARQFRKLTIPFSAKKTVLDTIDSFGGRFVEYSSDGNLIGVFDSAIHALRCVLKIQHDLSDSNQENTSSEDGRIVFRLAVYKCQPLHHTDGFFEMAIQSAKRMCLITPPNQITVSANLLDLFKIETDDIDSYKSQFHQIEFSEADEQFMQRLFDLAERNIPEENFNVQDLCKLIGISRAQLYRKILSLTGKSPNHFIRDLRMHKAWQLLKSKRNNITEIAYEVGYSNPSYFSKMFFQNFGYYPSSVLTSA
jgi:AraC-like DNA-binding protein